MSLHARIANSIFIAIALMGCRGVPDLAFDEDDASRSAFDASPPLDARSDGTVLVDAAIDADAIDADGIDADGIDASTSDSDVTPFDAAEDSFVDDTSVGPSHDASVVDSALPDAGSFDAGVPTCPAGPPPGASVCCKGVPCHGDASSCTMECTNCSNNCPGQTCCLDPNGNYHGCAKSPADCPSN